MIEDLIFKGKTIEEALNKAGNFFGVPSDVLKYDFEEDAPQGEIWIRLTENPLLAKKNSQPSKNDSGYSRPGKPVVRSRSKPLKEGGFQQRQSRRKPQRKSGGYGRQNKRHSSPGFDQKRGFYNDAGHGCGRRDNWKPADPDLNGLGEKEKIAYNFVRDILKRMGLRVDLLPVQDQARLILNIDGPDRGLLLTRKGEPLTALQYLVNKIFMSSGEMPQQIYIDSLGYRIARDEELREIALSSADKVRKSNKEYLLSPMNPYERRQIHLALKEDKEVGTLSMGEGYIKRVSIMPRDMIPQQADGDNNNE